MSPRNGDEQGIVVTACGRTHRGRVRKDNQDSLLVGDLGGRVLDWGAEAPVRGSSVGPIDFELSEKGAILFVADGMGGRAGGARASSLAIAAVREAMTDGHAGQAHPSPEAFVHRLQRALEQANRDIHEESGRDERYRGMGSTATLAGIRDGVVYLAQVGDSRAYLARSDALARLTRDQSLRQDLIDSGVLSEEDAKSVPDNVILQALGTKDTVSPEVTYHELRRDDVLLLCSDGLSHVVGDDEILAVVSSTTDCLAMCDQLIALANERGGPDNVTVLAARVGGEGLSKAIATDRIGRQVFRASEG